MFVLSAGNIVPAVRIGRIEIGMRKSSVETVIANCKMIDLQDYTVYTGENAKIWVSKTNNTITQITVFDNFGGKYLKRYGIGSYLADIEKHVGEKAIDDNDVYVFPEINGICFELSDIDTEWDDEEWFKRNSPVEAISVY